MAEELGTTEEPTGTPVEEPQKPELSQEDVTAFLSELEKAGVEKPEQLAGQLQNAKEYGRVGGLLGDERKKNDGLVAEMAELNKKMEKISSASYNDPYDNPAGEINIKDLVSGSVKDALREEREAQQRIQEQTMRTWGKIQGDPEFENVKDIWEAKTKDPNFVMQVQSGQIEPLEAFNNMKVDFYKGMARKSLKVIKTLTGDGPANIPHVEGGARTPKLTPESTETEQEMQDLKDKVNTGYIPSEDDELAALAKVLGG